MSTKKKIAIIGGGIAGLSSAFHLHRDYDITVFEKEDYVGGHTDTHELSIEGKKVQIDSGFIVFCRQYYPHFCQMLDQLNVPSKTTTMSFSARNHQTGVVYNATSLNKLFCQRRNLLNPSFYGMLFDLIRFYRTSPKVLKSQDTSTSVKQYLDDNGYGKAFENDHLFPMISALWSATPERVAQFPIRHLVDFLYKHGMMNLFKRPEWRVISNGSHSYVKALKEQLSCQWQTNSAVQCLKRTDSGVTIVTTDQQHQFDAVIIATHSDQALALLDQPSEHEKAILGAIKFENNHVVVHTDDSIMHPNKQAWASWNTEVPSVLDPASQRCCTANYWMNLLQDLPIKTNVFTTLNSQHRIASDKVLKERHYAHPIFTKDSVAAQKKLPLINGKNHTFYVGAYWGWGFHEDGARSAAQSCELLKQQLN